MADEIKDAGAAWLRKFQVDGLPSSGANEPDKDEGVAVFEAIQSEIDFLAAGQTTNMRVEKTWPALNAITGTAGAGAEITADAGTHTDPVVGGTVSNSGRFRYSTSPAGWERVDDAAGQNNLEATQAAQAATEAARDDVIELVEKRRGPAIQVTIDAADYASQANTSRRFWTPATDAERRARAKAALRAAFGPGGCMGIGGRNQSEFIAFNSFLGTDPYYAANEEVLPYAWSYLAGPRILSTAGTELSAIVPFHERAERYETSPGVFSNPYGETVLAGFMMTVHRLAYERYGLTLEDEGLSFLAGLPGASGTAAEDLLVGALDRQEAMIAAAPALLKVPTVDKPDRLTYSGCRVILDGQAFQDELSETDPDDWEGFVHDYHDAIEAKNLEVMGERIFHARIMAQLDTYLSAGATEPAIAWRQLDMETEPGFCRLVTRYQVELSGDGIHWTAWAGFEIGARMGQQWFARYIEGLDGVGIRIGEPIRDGATAFVPVTPLDGSDFDGWELVAADLPDAPANLSFQIDQAGGTPRTITSAVITEQDGIAGVLVTASSTLAAGDKLYHGRAGNSERGIGGVRDNDERLAIGQNGKMVPLYSYAPITRKVLA